MHLFFTPTLQGNKLFSLKSALRHRRRIVSTMSCVVNKYQDLSLRDKEEIEYINKWVVIFYFYLLWDRKIYCLIKWVSLVFFSFCSTLSLFLETCKPRNVNLTYYIYMIFKSSKFCTPWRLLKEGEPYKLSVQFKEKLINYIVCLSLYDTTSIEVYIRRRKLRLNWKCIGVFHL